jgi:hypothetical protein
LIEGGKRNTLFELIRKFLVVQKGIWVVVLHVEPILKLSYALDQLIDVIVTSKDDNTGIRTAGVIVGLELMIMVAGVVDEVV